MIGFLKQELQHMQEKTVFEEAQSAFNEALLLDKKIHDLQEELTHRNDYESADYHNKIDHLNGLTHRLEILDVSTIEKQIEQVLTGLGFEREEFQKAASEFSGGWQMRIELAKILLRKPELVLLDEPTNHLDIESIQWLESYLRTYPGAVILVSHDRTFLDTVTFRTIELVQKKIYDYPVPYSKFQELRKERIEQQAAAQRNQEKMIGHTEQLIEKFRYKASKAKFAQTLIHKLDKMERIEVDDEESASLHFYFPQPPRSGKMVVHAKGLSKNYGNKNVLNKIDFTIERGDKIAFIGKNGEGKSTLSKVIAGKEGFEGELQLGHNVTSGYYAQNQADQLTGDDSVYDVIDKAATGEIRTRIRGLLGAFLFTGDSIYKKVKVLSGGEKSRLALCRLLLEPANLIILDEPTNHLDMRSKDVLKHALAEFKGTVIIVSHDRDFLKGLTNRVFEFKAHKISETIGDIYNYLESRKIASLAELEIKTKKIIPGKNDISEKENYEQKKNKERELKKLQKEIEKTEGEISTLEKRIQSVEEQLKDPEFYKENMNNHSVFTDYEQMKADLQKKMEMWETLQSRLETWPA